MRVPSSPAVAPKGEHRLVIVLATTLGVIQVGLMALLTWEQQALTAAAIEDVLQSGYQSIRNQVREDELGLAAETRLMAAEFGLRQAVATRDQPTIDSMLENHQARSSRIRYAVVPRAEPSADAGPDGGAARTGSMNFELLRTLGEARLVARATADILAPLAIASLQGTLVVDDAYAQRIARLTGFELVVSVSDPRGGGRILASSVATAAPAAPPPGAAKVLAFGMHSFMPVKLLSLPDMGELWFWIGKPTAQAVPALSEVAAVVRGWLLLSLLLSVGAASAVAYRLVRPITASANTDALTGLLNRRGFEPNAASAFASCRSRGQTVALIAMDLDKFKPINDTLGHAAGDEVLRVIGGRLQRFFRSSDLVARLGGDEFCVLMRDVDPDRLQRLIDGLRQVLHAPIGREGRNMAVGCSVGVAFGAPGDALDLQALMDRADTALYDAKRSGEGFSFWEPQPAA